MPPTIVWFRRDLRLADHAPLREAHARGAVVPAFVWDPAADGAWPPGAASRWWLHHSLEALDASLRERGSRLIMRSGPSAACLRALAREAGATHVTFHGASEPGAAAHDDAVARALRADGLTVSVHPGALLVGLHELRTATGGGYEVFTPFWRKLASGPEPAAPTPSPRELAPPPSWPSSLELAELGLLPAIPWDAGLAATWTPGEAGARARLKAFMREGHEGYAGARDQPSGETTSRLSPHLHWGEISVRQAWHAATASARQARVPGVGLGNAWMRQLAWREFSAHLLARSPSAPEAPLRASFAHFPWRRDARGLRAWQRGRTGYPLVDAGMRELWATGWMHGRVRMVAASFLVKHLLLPWQAGEAWFWDTLVDADLANNAISWQWVAGCGADAAPFFRIFNPVKQGETFDARGAYVRLWVPELAGLPDRYVHAPWTAPDDVLRGAGVVLGRTYPHPIVDHATARARALEAFAAMRRAGTDGRKPVRPPPA